MIIEVVVPSLNRPTELERLRDSIPDGVLFTASRETEPRALTTCVNELIAKSTGDVVLVLADHVELMDGCIDAVISDFETAYPELDGMVGLNITNMEPRPGIREYCFFAIGRKLIEHFPDNRIFCPDYYHFSGDTELGEYANGAGVFLFDEDACIFLHHPNAANAPRDATHAASRIKVNQDHDMRMKRRKAGLLWGDTFELIDGAYG